jgi:hypothetical protein
MLSSRPSERSERVEGSIRLAKLAQDKPMGRIRVGARLWQSRCDSCETASGRDSGSNQRGVPGIRNSASCYEWTGGWDWPLATGYWPLAGWPGIRRG